MSWTSRVVTVEVVKWKDWKINLKAVPMWFADDMSYICGMREKRFLWPQQVEKWSYDELRWHILQEEGADSAGRLDMLSLICPWASKGECWAVITHLNLKLKGALQAERLVMDWLGGWVGERERERKREGVTERERHTQRKRERHTQNIHDL